ncbi:MAG: hypothetical protein V3T83_11150, partial [Acidobacteriota bacterium]
MRLGDEIRLEMASDGLLLLAGGLYAEAQPGLLQRQEGFPFFAAFEWSEEGSATHLFIGTGAYERIPWYST